MTTPQPKVGDLAKINMETDDGTAPKGTRSWVGEIIKKNRIDPQYEVKFKGGYTQSYKAQWFDVMRTPVNLVQHKGHPAIRAFDKPDASHSCIGEIPSDSRGHCVGDISKPTNGCLRALCGDLGGWVGAQHIHRAGEDEVIESKNPKQDEWQVDLSDKGSTPKWEKMGGPKLQQEITESYLSMAQTHSFSASHHKATVYEIDFEACVQRNKTTGKERPIRYGRQEGSSWIAAPTRERMPVPDPPVSTAPTRERMPVPDPPLSRTLETEVNRYQIAICIFLAVLAVAMKAGIVGNLIDNYTEILTDDRSHFVAILLLLLAMSVVALPSGIMRGFSTWC